MTHFDPAALLVSRSKTADEGAIIRMSQRARELRAKGADVVSLTLGEPDFDTPEHIKQAAIQAIQDNWSHYTPVAGYPDLRAAVCTKLKRDNGLDYAPENIVVSTGAKQCLANIAATMINPGDEVILPCPYWVSYNDIVKLNEGVPVEVQTVIDNDFKMIEKIITGNYKLTKQKGKPTILDSVKIKIASPILDSIYKKSALETLLKTGNQYKDQTFRNEADNVVKLFRNNGIYHFSESAIGFYVDSTRTDYKTNIDFLISSNRLIESNGNYIEKPFNVHTIKEVNVFTDYSFAKRSNSIKDSISYNGINFLAHDKIKYNLKYLSQSIFLKPNGIYKDTLRNLTRTHLKSLKNFILCVTSSIKLFSLTPLP